MRHIKKNKILIVILISGIVMILCPKIYAQVGFYNQTEGNTSSSSGNYVDELKINVGLVQEQSKPATPQVQNDVVANVEGVQPFQEIEIVGEGMRYTIGPGDILQIMVRNQQDFTGRFVVNENGFIQYNWVGDVKAAGLTKEELKVVLKDELKKFIRFPEVSVIILEYNSKFVYVLGDVARPGKYPMKGDQLTLRDAVLMAGLPTNVAAMKRTKVIRETEEGPQSINVDLKDILIKGKLENNYDLVPGDIIVIPTSKYHMITNVANKVISPLFQALAIYEIGFGRDDNGLFGGGDDD